MKRLLWFAVLFAVLVAVAVGFVLYNSMQSGEESHARSEKVADLLRPILDPMGRMKNSEYHIFVRKLAHIFEYTVLGMCIGGMFIVLRILTGKRFCFLPIITAVAIAVLDEYVQSFHGRSGRVKDVLFDSVGALVGLFCVALVEYLIRKILQGRKKHESEIGLQ